MLRHTLKTAVFVFTLIVFSFPVSAQDRVGVGEAAPSFELPDQAGAKHTFDSLKGNNGLVLAFVRSVDWCPYCKTQVKDIAGRKAEFNAAGYNVAVLSYDPQEDTSGFLSKEGLDLTLLSDARSQTIEAFGLRNYDYPMGTQYAGVPHPAIYVIGADGIVTHVFAEADYKKRPDLDTVLAAIRPPPAPEPASAPVETPVPESVESAPPAMEAPSAPVETSPAGE